MVITEQIAIRATVSVVWRVFSSIENWGQWNSVCTDCSVLEGEGLVRDACLSFRLKPYSLPIHIQPRITSCEPGREVVWKGKRLGLHAVHRFTFKQRGEEVVVRSTEKLAGPLLFVSKLLGIPSELHRLTRLLLEEIKKQAESASRSGPPG